MWIGPGGPPGAVPASLTPAILRLAVIRAMQQNARRPAPGEHWIVDRRAPGAAQRPVRTVGRDPWQAQFAGQGGGRADHVGRASHLAEHAVAGPGYSHLPSGRPPLMPEDPNPWGAPGPAGYFHPQPWEPNEWVSDPAVYAQTHPGYPFSKTPLMPDEGIVGPGPAGYFGPGGVPIGPGVRSAMSGGPDFTEALARLLSERQRVRF